MGITHLERGKSRKNSNFLAVSVLLYNGASPEEECLWEPPGSEQAGRCRLQAGTMEQYQRLVRNCT